MEKLKKINWGFVWIVVGVLWIGVMVVLLPIGWELLLTYVVGSLITPRVSGTSPGRESLLRKRSLQQAPTSSEGRSRRRDSAGSKILKFKEGREK